MQLAQQDDAGSGAALVAVVRAGPVLIVESETVLAAAYRAGAVLVGQKAGVDPKLREDFPPALAGALDGAPRHAAPAALACALA